MLPLIAFRLCNVSLSESILNAASIVLFSCEIPLSPPRNSSMNAIGVSLVLSAPAIICRNRLLCLESLLYFLTSCSIVLFLRVDN